MNELEHGTIFEKGVPLFQSIGEDEAASGESRSGL